MVSAQRADPHTRAAGIDRHLLCVSTIGGSQHPRRSHPPGPMFRVSRLAAVAALIATCAQLFPRGAHALGVTDDHPLVVRQGAPDTALCDRADAGHRRATQRGDQMLKLGRLEVAEACYLGALRLKNDFPMALYGLGEVHTRAEDDDRVDLAESAYKLALENWPQYVDAYIALGDLHERRERNDDAVAAYTKALEVAPGDVMAWEALGRHHLATSDFDKARDAYEKSLTSATNGETSPGLILGLAKAAWGAGSKLEGAEATKKFVECVSHAEKATNLAPDFGQAAHWNGKCRTHLKQTKKAMELLFRAVELDPEQPEHHSFLAGELVKLGRVKEAREVIMKGMEWVEKDEAAKEKAFQAAAAEEDDGKDEL